MMPTPTDLQYFMEVAKTCNLSRAAERIGISQPTLSLAIRRLEDAVGAELLLRSKRGVQLTLAGGQLLSQTQRLLQHWELVRSEALAAKYEARGRFTLGVHTSVALFTLPYVLPNLLAKYPQLELNFSHQLSRKITEAIVSSELDMGVVVNPVNHPDLVIRKLSTDEVTLWVCQREGLVQEKTMDTLICDPSLLQTQVIFKKLRDKNIKFKRTMETSSLELIAELAARGCGVGILPSRVARRPVQGLVKSHESIFCKDKICYLYRADRRATLAIQIVGRELTDFFATEVV